MQFFATLLTVFLFQQVYTPSEFAQVSGATLKARYDSAISQGSRGADETFWIAYRFPVRAGIQITTWGDSNSIIQTTSSDGIEWIPDNAQIQRVAIFALVGKADGVIQKSRLINLNQNFRVHDRKVYWLGEPNAEESLTLLEKLAAASPQKFSSSLVHYMSLHDGSQVADHLLQLSKSTTVSTELRRSAILQLGREISRQAGDELNRLAFDANTDVQRSAVSAISRRKDDEAIPALIRVARENPNPAVRNYAIQLLGQKQDPRILDFFEQMLKKK